MKILVIGASGGMGRLVADRLEKAGADVVRAHRAVGVDAYTGAGLAEAARGVDVIVECANNITQRASKAIDFFGTVAANVSEAARDAGVQRVVCLSIVNAAQPQVNSKMGYYQGKARQEEVYRRELGDRVILFRTTQWFELGATMLDSMSLGPVGVMAHMLSRPLAVADGADLLADVALNGGAAVVEVAGPADLDMLDVAREIARRRGTPRWVLGINFGGKVIRSGALRPDGAFEVTATTFGQWLDQTYPAAVGA
ncbi:NmrA family transcriptional regulator [Gordonia sp. TBRC 11910]|uniref:NmrA family transcriptional regulator n=1 Tax=Gordonia asplenii TaxID=2725283 RepID=A0A848KVR0_9ACTN|nr:NAD-dependent epimerase/dehydratase family protein [Gordonia asplenii]NMO02369.1 NmrA family transcriptional regulator [Gordonia asplenii]